MKIIGKIFGNIKNFSYLCIVDKEQRIKGGDTT